MSEKLSDGQVIDALAGLRDQQSYELSGVRFALKDERHDSTLNRLRESIYERRIAALDAVLAERRERKESA